MKILSTKTSIALASIALLVACIKDGDSSADTAIPTSGDVSFTTSIKTRVCGNQFEEGNQVYVKASDGQDALYSYADDTFTAVSTPIELTEGSSLSYCATYPSEYTSVDAAFDFTADADQSAGYEMSDLLVANVGSSSSDKPELTFYHAMMSVVLTVVNDEGAAIEDEVTVEYSLVNVALVDITSDSYTASSGAEAVVMTPYVEGNKFTIVAAPQEVNTIATVTYKGTPYVWSYDSALSFVSGSQYTYTLEISLDDQGDPDPTMYDIEFTGKIEDWNIVDLNDDATYELPTIDEPQGTTVVTIDVATDFPNSGNENNATTVGLGTDDYVFNGVTISFADGAASTATRTWYDSGWQIRGYAGSTITFTAPEDKVITNIVLTTSASGYADYSAAVGDYSTTTTAGTWSGSANSVVLTCAANSRILAIEVTCQ